MGRKIPGRKHRGVKDPEKQRQVKFELIKNKINQAPTNPDEQHIPQSLARFAELKEKTKQGVYDRRPKKNKANRQPAFKRFKGESDDRFMFRVRKICDNTIKEAKFGDKYGVDIKRDAKTGRVESIVKRKPDEIDLLMKKGKKQKKKTKTKKTEEPKLTKSQKRRKKLVEKKERRELSKVNEFGDYKDEVKFGEVVHEPPNLSLPKKIGPLQYAPRPGKKDLLLKSALSGDEMHKKNAASSDVQLKKTANKVIDKKGRRKDLPHALRRQLDKQREEIVSVYRKLKEKKNSL